MNMYHKGEEEIQRLVGEELQANSNGRIITDSIIKGAINFIEKQPMFIASSVDADSNVWVSLLLGDFGIVSVPTPNSISVNLNKMRSDPNDIFYSNIKENGVIGTLFIELNTRRRFRINGNADRLENRINVSILEAYPNCPKYIQQRVISSSDSFGNVSAHKTEGSALTDELEEWISNADTLFVGSQSGESRMDASHRGGHSGFVELLNGAALKIPDYQGNSMYNTLGNFQQNTKAGLLFVDFENKRTLQLTGEAELLFNQTSDDDLVKTTGTGRYWIFHLKRWILTNSHHDVNWEFLGYSPFNPIENVR